jgi:hypothetical protein
MIDTQIWIVLVGPILAQLSLMRSTIGWLRQHYAEPLRIEVLAQADTLNFNRTGNFLFSSDFQ